MRFEDYPALYQEADQASNRSQSGYLWTLRTQYGLLILASIFGVGISDSPFYFIAYAFVIFLSMGALLYAGVRKPEKDWYQLRAFAESIKTLTWRYVARAHPFETADDIRHPNTQFRNLLRENIEDSKHIGDALRGYSISSEQVTTNMREIRESDLSSRKKYYLDNRINDQRLWYIKKAQSNRKSQKRWVILCVFIYLIAGLSVLLRIEFTHPPVWFTEPLIVIGASIVGWMQIKKFNELSSAYTLAAHEIGLLKSEIQEIDSEEAFSQFVNRAELAFSREHTQWVARQSGL